MMMEGEPNEMEKRNFRHLMMMVNIHAEELLQVLLVASIRVAVVEQLVAVVLVLVFEV